jgi:hypothetical protein
MENYKWWRGALPVTNGTEGFRAVSCPVPSVTGASRDGIVVLLLVSSVYVHRHSDQCGDAGHKR